MNSENFKERPFEEETGGQYDEQGFYYTLNGSFWDPDGVYFNKEGFDRHGGYYNYNLEYIPGPGWIEELLCYEDEKEQVIRSSNFSNRHHKHRNETDEIYDGDDLDDDQELYDVIDYEKIMEEEEEKFAKMNMNIDLTPGRVNKNNENLKINTIEQSKETPSGKINHSTNINTDANSNTGSKCMRSDIPTDLLFKQIPESKKQIIHGNDNKYEKNTVSESYKARKEKQIEVESLFQ